MTESAFHPVCKVNGCPLPATVVTDRWPDGDGQPAKPRWGICEWHDMSPGKDWPRVSRLTRENKEVLMLMHDIQSLPDETRPLLGETFGEWFARVARYLWSVIVPGYDPGYPSVEDQVAAMKRQLKGLA